MEIERKFLISGVDAIPYDLKTLSHRLIEQAYLCTEPVVRIRRDDVDYYLTYKSKGLLSREEYNLPLTQEAYLHLKEKADGQILTKTRYLIPLSNSSLTIELDVFSGSYEGLILAEVEFASEEDALSFTPPEWFGRDVTFSGDYHNSKLALSDGSLFHN